MDWVAIAEHEILLTRPRLRNLVVRNADGKAHLRLDPAGRCVALRGKMGRQVSCSIYEVRPRACHRVQAGSARCLQYRHERGLG